MNKNILGIVLIVVVVGGASYMYGKSSVSIQKRDDTSSFSQNGGRRGAGMVRAGDSFINGEILSLDGTSVTIKLRDSGSKLVFISASSTRITKTTEGSFADLATGRRIMIGGSTNSDGSMTATTIQLREDNQ